MLEAAAEAFLIITDPNRMLFVALGTLLGLMIGVIPGIGGLVGLALLLPFTFALDPYTALAFLVGVQSVTTTSDTIPAVLFGVPGTTGSAATVLDGYPMAQKGQAKKALRVAHLSSASGDTFSDLVLFVCAPFLAILVERFLDLPEKTGLIILSLSFIAAVIGGSVAKGLISTGIGLFAVYIGMVEDLSPRLSVGTQELSQGFPITTSVLGVLIIGAVFMGLEELWTQKHQSGKIEQAKDRGDQRLRWPEIKRLLPFIGRSAVIGTAIGALPGIGSTLAATLGHTLGKSTYDKKKAKDAPGFGEGVPEGVAATEAANSSVSGANLIPVLSLGIPGNAAAVFLILAAESLGGLNPGPSVFRFTTDSVNPELVAVFGLFTCMVIANLCNWTIGGVFMRTMGVLMRSR